MNTEKTLATLLISLTTAISMGQSFQATRLENGGGSIAFAHAYNGINAGAVRNKKGIYNAALFKGSETAAVAPAFPTDSAAFWYAKDGVAIVRVFSNSDAPSTCYWWSGSSVKQMAVDKYKSFDVAGAAPTGNFCAMGYSKDDTVGTAFFYAGKFKKIEIPTIKLIRTVAMNDSETCLLEGTAKSGARQLFLWNAGNYNSLPIEGKNLHGFAISPKNTVAGSNDQGNIVLIAEGQKPQIVGVAKGARVEISTVQDNGEFVGMLQDEKHPDGALIRGDATGYSFLADKAGLDGKYDFNEGWALPGETYIVAHNRKDDYWYKIETVKLALGELNIPAKTLGGSTYKVTIGLNGKAVEDTTIKFDFDHSLAKAPDSVTIKKGETSATFGYTVAKTGKVYSTSFVAYSAYGKTGTTTTVYPYSAAYMDATPNYFAEGGSTKMVLHLPAAAPEGGLKVALTVDQTKLAKIPSSIFIAAGETEGAFAADTTASVDANTKVLVSANYGVDRIVGTFTVRPLRIDGLKAETTTAKAGQKVTITVVLEAAASSTGRVIKLASSSKSLEVPASITVPAGQQTTTFTAVVTGKASETATITASAPANNVYWKVKIN